MLGSVRSAMQRPPWLEGTLWYRFLRGFGTAYEPKLLLVVAVRRI